MNKHIFGDRVLLTVATLFGKPFFRDSIDGPGFEEHLEAIEISTPEIDGEVSFQAIADTLDGEHVAPVKVLHWRGSEAPTLFYNQGGAERPVDRTMSRAYPKNDTTNFNIVAVGASCQSSTAELNKKFASLNTYTCMVAFAVKLNEHLLNSDAFRNARATMVTGSSLGGFATSRHHLIYDSADVYVPFVSGTKHGEIFLTTIATGKAARANPDAIRSRLNFDKAWSERSHPNVYPVLGRYDQLNRFEVMAPSYGDMDLTVWEGGHLHGHVQPQRMRKIMDQRLQAAIERKTNGSAL